ncbi:hypothetical protein DAHU10_000740 [Hanseniaspora uvarum]|nr:hypothetical protein DAHU10_000740 [Hanseniaspora uvarum]
MSNTTKIAPEKLKLLTEETITTLAAHKYIESRSNIQEVFNLSEQSTLEATKKQAEDIREIIKKMKESN